MVTKKEHELFERWIKAIRLKASQYEHTARKRGEEVTVLDLDSLANEMIAYIAGREYK